MHSCRGLYSLTEIAERVDGISTVGLCLGCKKMELRLKDDNGLAKGLLKLEKEPREHPAFEVKMIETVVVTELISIGSIKKS